MSIRFKGLTKKDMRKIVEHYDTMKRICVVCEVDVGNEKKMLIKLWGSLYIDPERQEAYDCECIQGVGTCKCNYNPSLTELYRRMMTEGIRIV